MVIMRRPNEIIVGTLITRAVFATRRARREVGICDQKELEGILTSISTKSKTKYELTVLDLYVSATILYLKINAGILQELDIKLKSHTKKIEDLISSLSRVYEIGNRFGAVWQLCERISILRHLFKRTRSLTELLKLIRNIKRHKQDMVLICGIMNDQMMEQLINTYEVKYPQDYGYEEQY